jgi:hypothetical protein
MFTESERECSKYYVIPTENERRSHLGQGYYILITIYNQNVQGEGICWSFNFNFESTVYRIDSETEKNSILILRVLMKETLMSYRI